MRGTVKANFSLTPLAKYEEAIGCFDKAIELAPDHFV
jgi:Tetratricopeptide repeat.